MALGLSTRMSLPGVQSLLARLDADTMLQPSELASLDMPLLLFWGAQDDLLGEEHLDFFRLHMPDHTEILQPTGYGHAPFLDDRKGFVEAIRPFIEARLAPARGGS
jgi:pimeloyl-ACP methyl ester carboxylesterase